MPFSGMLAAVRGFAEEFDRDRRAGDVGRREVVPEAARVRAERRIHVLEEPFAHEAALGAAVLAAFFAGRAVDAHLAARLVDHGLEADGGKRGGGAEKIVPAAVPEAGQGVVFGEEDEHGAGLRALIDGGEAGRVPRHVGLHGKALAGEQLGEALAGEVLVVAHFGMLVDVLRAFAPVGVALGNAAEDFFVKSVNFAHVFSSFQCRR
jgi:hypothetical protein